MSERVRGWVLCGVYVCVTGCVCVSVCVPWHTWRSEDNLRGLVLSYFLKAESLKQPEMVVSARLPIAGPVLPSLCGMAEITDGHRHMDFLHWFQGTSSAFQPRLCKNHFHPPNHPRASVIFFSPLCLRNEWSGKQCSGPVLPPPSNTSGSALGTACIRCVCAEA